MDSMISSILTIKQLLKNKPSLEIGYLRSINSIKPSFYPLSENRCFCIPGYQREISWNTNNVQILIEDLIDRAKFLGYILVSTYDDTKFNIIDGQQRLTVFFMILEAMARRDNSLRFETCAFENESFKNIKDAIQNGFYADDDKKKSECISGDDLHQYDAYIELFDFTNKQIASLSNENFGAFKDNLLESEINLIIQPVGDKNSEKKVCVDYFIDINNKSVKLNYIEILKAYAFKEEFESLPEKWADVQKNNKGVPFDEYHYPIETMFLHYILCSINSVADGGVKALTDDLKIQQLAKVDGITYEIGTDIEEIIGDKPFYRKMLDTVQGFIDFEKVIMNDKFSYGMDFDVYIKPEKAAPNGVFKQNMFNICGDIIRSSDVVPKLLLMKYFIEVIQNTKATYDDYKLIYNIGILSTFFTAAQGDSKKRAEFSGIVLNKNWKKQLISKSEQKIKKQPMPLVFDKIVKQCGSYTESSGQYLARRVHSVLYAVTDNGKMKFNEGMFHDYNSDRRYNDEHFLINQSYGIVYKIKKKEYKYNYPERIRSYVSHLGNYLFIKKELNRDMGNTTIKDKFRMIEDYKKKNKDVFKDKLSELKYKAAKKAFNKCKCPTREELSKCASIDEANALLDQYFTEEFVDDYKNYAKDLKETFSSCNINDFK